MPGVRLQSTVRSITAGEYRPENRQEVRQRGPHRCESLTLVRTSQGRDWSGIAQTISLMQPSLPSSCTCRINANIRSLRGSFYASPLVCLPDDAGLLTQQRGYSRPALTGRPQGHHLRGIDHGSGPTDAPAICLGLGHPRPNSLLYQTALELSHGSDDVELQTASGSSKVDLVSHAHERNPQRFKFRQRVHEMLQAAGVAV